MIKRIFGTFLALLSKVIMLGGVAILTARLLGPDDRGSYALIVATANIISLVGCFGIQNALTVEGVQGKGNAAFSIAMLHLIGVTCILVLLAWVVDIYAIELGLTFNTAYVWVIVLAVFSIMGSTFVRELSLGLFKQRDYNFYLILPDFITLAFLILLYFSIGNVKLEYAVGVFSVSFFIVLLFSLITISYCYKYSFSLLMDWTLYCKMIGFGRKTFFSAILEFANIRFALYFTALLSLASDVGYYSIALTIALASLALPSAISVVLFPEAAKSRDPGKLENSINMLVKVTLVLELLFAFFMLGVSDWIFVTLFGEDFLPSSKVFLLMLPGVISMSISRVLFGYMMGVGRPDAGIIAGLLSVITSVILFFVLIPTYGSFGAAISFSAAYILGAIAMVFMYQRQTTSKLTDLFFFSKNDLLTLNHLITRVALKAKD